MDWQKMEVVFLIDPLGTYRRRVEVADRPSIKTPFPFYTWAGTFSVYVVVQGQICNTYKLI